MPEIDFAQIIGLVSLLIGATNFLNKDDKKFRIQTAIFCIFIGFHFYLMGALTGALVCIIGAVRSAVSIKTKNHHLLIVFSALYWIIGLPTATEIYELLPMIGSTFATIAFFKYEGIKMRLTIGINSLCWLIHNIIIFSIGGILMELLFISFNLYTIYSLNRDQHKRCTDQVCSNC